MWHAAREPHGLAGPCVDTLATGHHRQGAGGDPSFLILEVMNVHRGAFRMRGQRASELEDRLSVLIPPAKLEDLWRFSNRNIWFSSDSDT
jgi:hypothetical protein